MAFGRWPMPLWDWGAFLMLSHCFSKFTLIAWFLIYLNLLLFFNRFLSTDHRVVVFISMSIQNTLLDAAAADMAHTFQRTYLSLLLQQDTVYFDLTDVAGMASMIEGEANKIKKG